MSDIWNWSAYGADESAGSAAPETSAQLNAQIVGYDVEASDGNVGKIDQASFETSSGFLVVDTGWWIFGKKRLIPAGLVMRVDDQTKSVHVSCSKETIKSAPDFEEGSWEYDNDVYRARHGDYYGGL